MEEEVNQHREPTPPPLPPPFCPSPPLSTPLELVSAKRGAFHVRIYLLDLSGEHGIEGE